MKKAILLLTAILAVSLTSCSEETTLNTYHVDDITVDFGTQNLVTESDDIFNKEFSTFGFDDNYTHTLPTSFTAYFVCKTSKGQYNAGQVVKVLTVTTGFQQITIPKLDYTIYVTNHIKAGDPFAQYAWYTWSNAINQLPVTSNEILLFGKNTVDYNVVTEGTVALMNNYSAVMIKNNESIAGAPFFNTGNVPYTLVSGNSWYLLYIKNATTSTEIPVTFGTSANYQLNKDIEANKIYQYTLVGVGDTEGNLTITTTPLINGTAEELPILN